MSGARRARVVTAVLALAATFSAAPAPRARGEARLLPDGPAPLAYRVEVTVHPDGRGYRGRLRLDAPGFGAAAPLPDRWHLWLNAFAHDQTTWMRTASRDRVDLDAVLAAHDDPWGFVALDAVRCFPADGAPRRVAHRFVTPIVDDPLDRTVVALDLGPCGGGAAAPSVAIDFHGRLPVPIARTGAVPGWSTFAQWLPKVAGVQGDRVVDAPYFGSTEFFANFADWDVTIDAAEGATVAATGERAAPEGTAPPGLERHRFRQRWVHDFAFLVARDPAVVRLDHVPPGRRTPVALRVVLPRARRAQASRVLAAARAALDVLGARVGPYPHDVLTVLAPPPAAARTAGMEYPTLVVGATADPIWDRFGELRLPELVTAHEVAHQYFQGVIATNEMEEAWLDEGLAEHWTWEILRAMYGAGREGGAVLGRPVDGLDAQALRRAREPTPVPVTSRPSYRVDADDVGTHFYRRPSTILSAAARVFGRGPVDATFRLWLSRHRFAHPRGDDFLAAAADAAGPRLASFLRRALDADRSPSYAVRSLRSARRDPPRGRAARDGAPGAGDAIPGGDPTPGGGGDPGETLRVIERFPGVVVESGRGAGAPAPGDERALAFRWTRRPDRPVPGGSPWRSEVRVAAPSWPGWGTTVRLAFADGSVARGRLDAVPAPYRDLALRSPAPLESVRLARVPADPDPTDDGLLRAADEGLVRDLAGWVAAGVQWLAAAGVGLWL